MGCAADQFHAAGVRLVIGFGAIEAGQEGVVDVDATPRQLRQQPGVWSWFGFRQRIVGF